MINKKVPLRMCIACKESKPKKELIRIVKFEDNFSLDFTGKSNGRGAYICDSEECLNKVVKQKLLNKTFKQNISCEVYDDIKEKYIEHKQN